MPAPFSQIEAVPKAARAAGGAELPGAPAHAQVPPPGRHQPRLLPARAPAPAPGRQPGGGGGGLGGRGLAPPRRPAAGEPRPRPRPRAAESSGGQHGAGRLPRPRQAGQPRNLGARQGPARSLQAGGRQEELRPRCGLGDSLLSDITL